MTPAEHAQTALLVEVAGTPKPGNVDRHREYPDLRFEHFLAGAVGARPGLEAAAGGATVGVAFERAVRGMSQQSGGNTQFGGLLLVVPLLAASAVVEGGELTPEAVDAVVRRTTVEDAIEFYRAFEHVPVAVPDPPEGADDLDVRRGSDAEPAIRERELALIDVMELAAPVDGIAREWTQGFPRTFAAADRLSTVDGPIADRAAAVYLERLAEEPDPFVATTHDPATASEVCERAVGLLDADRTAVEAFADDLVERGINPGTTADIVAAGLFVALERGEITP